MPASVSSPHPTRRQFLGAGVAAALGSWAVLGGLQAERAGASRSVPEAATPIGPRRIAVVGDSLTVGSLPYLPGDLNAVGWTGSTIDANVSRGIRTKIHSDRYTGITAVAAMRERFGDYSGWIVALGTNDSVIYPKSKQADVITMMMDVIGPGHRVVWTNVYLPDKPLNQRNWNATLNSVAADRDDMFVFDWAGLAAANPQWITKDGIHCTALGYQRRSQSLAMATRSMLPSDDSYWLMPGESGVRLFVD